MNQLLAKIDGVEQLNNILVIGMTNRRDMIDEGNMKTNFAVNDMPKNFFLLYFSSHAARSIGSTNGNQFAKRRGTCANLKHPHKANARVQEN